MPEHSCSRDEHFKVQISIVPDRCNKQCFIDPASSHPLESGRTATGTTAEQACADCLAHTEHVTPNTEVPTAAHPPPD
jgi:hypothetical protein